MVRMYDERANPKVRTPVTDGMYQSYERSLVCGQLLMSSSHLLAEERKGTLALVEYSAKPGARGIAFDDKVGGEVWQV